MGKTLIDEYISFLENQHQIMSGKLFSRLQKAKAKERFLKFLESSEVYISHSSQGRIEKSIVAIQEMNMEHGPTIAVLLFKLNNRLVNKKSLQKIFDHIDESFGSKKLPIVFVLLPTQKKLKNELIKMGFEVTAYKMAGQIAQSERILLKNIEKQNIAFKFELLKEKDFKDYAELEVYAHESDQSSRINKTVRKLVYSDSFGKQYFQMIVKNKTGYVLRENGKLIATVSYFISQGSVPVGTVGSISIAPEYQGRGLSKLLYLYCLQKMRKKNLKFYTGNTTTTKVLSLSKKIKRKSIAVILFKKMK